MLLYIELRRLISAQWFTSPNRAAATRDTLTRGRLVGLLEQFLQTPAAGLCAGLRGHGKLAIELAEFFPQTRTHGAITTCRNARDALVACIRQPLRISIVAVAPTVSHRCSKWQIHLHYAFRRSTD